LRAGEGEVRGIQRRALAAGTAGYGGRPDWDGVRARATILADSGGAGRRTIGGPHREPGRGDGNGEGEDSAGGGLMAADGLRRRTPESYDGPPDGPGGVPHGRGGERPPAGAGGGRWAP